MTRSDARPSVTIAVVGIASVALVGAAMIGAGTAAAAGPAIDRTLSTVRITVDPASGRHPISPLIYGINDDPSLSAPGAVPDSLAAALTATGVTLVRLGGNRYTAYNWENNASNAGSDWLYENDDYLSSSTIPGAVADATVSSAQTAGASALVTIPIGDYVAADTAPRDDVRLSGPNYLTTRFRQNRATGGPLSLTPDTSDGAVYQNQFVYWLAQTHPGANVMYSLDNEPNDWQYTHAEVFARNFTYDELIARNLQYARAIKAVSPGAKVTGPVLDGWQGQEDPVTNDGNSPDHQAHGRFLDYYLDSVRAADLVAGHRVIDILDLHWYPQVAPEVFTLDSSPARVQAREQAPRSLWDPTYVENSWIAIDVLGSQPIRLLPRVQAEIAAHNPGMGLAISEWNYGGGHDISGGIATADTLGIFGREGVTAATFWPQFSPNEQWSYGAFALFRNFDGGGASFGDTAVAVSDSDTVGTSAFASVYSADPARVATVVINKGGAAQPSEINVNSSTSTSAQVYTLTGASATPQRAADLTTGRPGSFSYTMPAQSVSLIVMGSGGSAPPTPPVTDPTDPSAPPGAADLVGQSVSGSV
ncbi:MAG: glycoside hydrolase family 44 protein, partial [Actinomycetes bacterium]